MRHWLFPTRLRQSFLNRLTFSTAAYFCFLKNHLSDKADSFWDILNRFTTILEVEATSQSMEAGNLHCIKF